MDIITSIAGAVREFFGWRRAKEENRVNPVVVRREDKAEREQAAGAARAEIAAGDTAAMARTVDRVTAGETGGERVPGYQEQAREAQAEITAGDGKAMTKTLRGLLGAALCVCVAGCVTPTIPPAVTWEVKPLTIDGQEYIAVPTAVYSRMVDRLVYLKALEEQGRVRDE